MTLETYSDLPIASPLSIQVGGEPNILTLSELTTFTLLHIRGVDAETMLEQSIMKIGDVAPLDGEILARLRHDEFLLLAMQGQAALRLLEERIGERHVTVTDITHGRCVLLLVGQQATSALRKVCALDFSDAAFLNLHAAQTSLAKVRSLIIGSTARPPQTYFLIVDRSLGQYVWDVVADAMQEFAN